MNYINGFFSMIKKNKNALVISLLLTLFPQITFYSIYKAGLGYSISYALSLSGILVSVLATANFCIFLSFSNSFLFEKDYPIVILAVSYGLSSYILVQEQALPVILCYAFFPLLSLAFEKAIKTGFYIPFIVLESFFLALAPSCAIPCTLLLCIYCVFELIKQTSSFETFFRVCACTFFSYCISAIRIVDYFIQAKRDGILGYAGFSMSYSFGVTVSKILSFAAPSIVLSSSGLFDVSIGIFCFLLLIIYFFNNNISIKIRVCDCVFLLLTLGCIAISPLRYLISLGIASSESISYSFVWIFYALLLVAKQLQNSVSPKRRNLLGACIFFVAIILYIFLFVQHNYTSLVLISLVLFSALYLIYALVYYLSDTKLQSSLLLICVLAVELFINTLVSTNLYAIPSGCDSKDTFAYANLLTHFEDKAQPASITPQQNSNPSGDTTNNYKQYISSHTDLEVNSILTSLYIISNSMDLSKYNSAQQPFSNIFETFNASCHELGIAEDLFIPINYSMSFEESDQYNIQDTGNHIYAINQKHVHPEDDAFSGLIRFHIATNGNEQNKKYILRNNYDTKMLSFSEEDLNDVTHILEIIELQDVYCNVSFDLYGINEHVLVSLPEVINAHIKSTQTSVTVMDYISLLVSLLSFFILLLIIIKEKQTRDVFLKVTVRIASRVSSNRFVKYFKRNRSYFVAFCIPFFIYLTCMVINDCKPFGNASFFDEDGAFLTLPSFMDFYYNLLKGNTYLSMNGGYGYNLYVTNPTIELLSFFKLLSPSAIEPLLLIGEAFCLGLCSLTMCFYLTHRKRHIITSSVSSPALISAGCIYALNAYMLSMHCFSSWYFMLLFVPLVFYALDLLVYQGNFAYYIVFLSICIILNWYLSLYLCLFLIVWFLTYSFTNFRDFISKGTRFALCSILSAGNSFFVISSTYFATYYSNYKTKDGVFPSAGLYTNYLNIIKQHLIFSGTTTVTNDNGHVNAFLGILPFLCFFIYMLCRSISIKAKLQRLIPILIMYWCFNGKIMSFIWNGLHYQTKVPNRYAFLLMFCIAELFFDTIHVIKEEKSTSTLLATIGVIILFSACKFYNQDISNITFYSSVALIIIYAFIIIVSGIKASNCISFLCFILVCELGCNAIHSTRNFDSTLISSFGNYVKIADNIQNKLNAKEEYFRVQFPAANNYNSSLYNIGSSNLFNSYVGAYQTNTNRFFGYCSGTNFTKAEHNSSLLSSVLSATKYIYLNSSTYSVSNDLANYNYIGSDETYHIYQNPYALSLGYFLPEESFTHTDDLEYIPLLCEKMCEDVLPGNTFIYNQVIPYSTDPAEKQRFYYTDCEGNNLDVDDITEIVTGSEDSSIMHSLQEIQLHISFEAEESGYAYIFSNEYVSIREVEKGEHVTETLYYPNKLFGFPLSLNIVIQKPEAIHQLYSELSKNQLGNISIHDNMVEGTVNYEKDGYTFYSLAYDKSWHAYIDGKEVEVEDPYYSCLAVKTPAGKHTITLKYIPYGMWPSKLISLGFMLLSLIICLVHAIIVKSKKTYDSKQQCI